MQQVVHIPYTAKQTEDGTWHAGPQLLSQAAASGTGNTREEAVADLRKTLAGMIAEFGAPEEITLALDVVSPRLRSEQPRRWNVWSRWKAWRRRQRSRRFSLEEWEPATRNLTAGQQSYVRIRWAYQIEQLDARHRKDVLRFYILRTVSILSGVAVTALSGIGLSGKTSSAEVRWVIFALGFLVAGSAAMEQLGNFNQHRMLARGAREDLLSAGFSLLLPEATAEQFDAFRVKIEQILHGYNQAYGKTLSGP